MDAERMKRKMKGKRKLLLSLLMTALMILALPPSAAYAEGGMRDSAAPEETIKPLGAAVTEQFNLTPGGTYYFDMSKQGAPGSVNNVDSLPDISLKWVPFTYAGTVNAYSLDASSSGDTTASGTAAVSNRSLFVANCLMTFGFKWNDLNSANLVFGKDYTSGGVSYELRSLSVGSTASGSGSSLRGVPVSNEWDQILNKNADYIKNWSDGYSWGQDTVSDNANSRVQRGRDTARYFAVASSSMIGYSIGFRPALELTSDTSTDLKTVTFAMGSNGTIGSKGALTSATMVYAGTLALPEITAANGFKYTGSSGPGKLGWYAGSTFYMPGAAPALATGTTLTAGYGALSSESDITGFMVAGQVGNAAISTAGHTVEFHMPSGTDVTALAPDITVSDNALISPVSGTARNFSSSASYTVTAQDGTEQVWTVTCIVDAAPVNAVINPETCDYDVNAPADVSTTITWNSASSVENIAYSVNPDTTLYPLGAGDYVVDNDTLIIKHSFFTDIPIAAGDSLDFTITFDTNDAVLTVNVVAVVVPVPVMGITVTATGGVGSVQAGNTLQMLADVSPPNAADQSVTWSISAGSGAAINASGLLTATAAGSVTIRAAANDSSGVYGEKDIIITAIPAYTITASTDSGGSISPNGIISVASGGSKTFIITPDSKYQIDTVRVDGVDQGAITTYTFTNITANHTISATFTRTSGSGSGGSGGGGGASSTSSALKYEAKADVSNGSVTILPVTVDEYSGSAGVDVGTVSGLMSEENITTVTVQSVPGIDTYTLGLPVPKLATPDNQGKIVFKTSTGNITVSSNMITGVAGISEGTAEISIGQGDKRALPEDVKAAIGDRPLVQLTLSIDGKQIDWNNPDAPVTVSIPYTPTAEELAHPESIVIWYIDGSGNAVTIPNGHYDPATGAATFDTTHFSGYAVVYSKVNFYDVTAGAWYGKAVNFLAAREVTGGTGNGYFSPDAKLTRGDFLVLMMRAYGIAPDLNPADNFSDAGDTYYTGYLAAAKRIGITAGVGGSLYAPGKEITRQEMFTLLYNALKVIGQLPQGDSGKSLSNFSDAGQITAWANEAMTRLVETGTVGGSDGKLLPADTTTRAEMAQVLYNLLAK